jgi:hypothetical protein
VPLKAARGGLPEVVAVSRLDRDGVRSRSHHEWPIAANRNVVMENFLESYRRRPESRAIGQSPP